MRDKALQVVWTLTACTALALLGDATLYAVLPSSYAAVGITAMQVGWLLSINRLARIPINLLSGRLCRRWGARWPYIVGVGVGALSTIGYALVEGFWPLLALRALWGVAWALLVVAANTLVLQVSGVANRGRNNGIYTPYSFFGGALGAVLGGVLVDRLGFQPAMAILGALTGLGCLLALSLPHIPAPTREGPLPTMAVRTDWAALASSWRQTDPRVLLVLATVLLHRLFFAGVFYATFGYFLKERFAQGLGLGVWLLGGATLTSVLLWTKDLVTVSAGPALGHLSDRLNDRPLVLALGLGAGVAGLLTLAITQGAALLLLGVALVAVAYGIVPPLLISWLGDLTPPHKRSGILGVFQAVGDLGSGLGPLFAYRLVQAVDIGVVYVACAALLALLLPFILRSQRAHAGAQPDW